MGNEISLIYLYGFSTTLEDKLNSLVQIVKSQITQETQVSIVFIHDGVIGTTQRTKSSHIMKELLNLPITFYAMIPDLNARGIDAKNLQNKVKGVEYKDLVDLLVTTSKIVSWM